MISIYTDGSVNDNKKSSLGGVTGGAGMYVLEHDHSLSLTVLNSTNNISELTAIKLALNYIKDGNIDKEEYIVIYSDSMYCVNSLTNWYIKWRQKGWKKSTGETIKNVELIKNIINTKEELEKNYDIKIKHCKAHSGLKGNEIADKLAKEACKN